MNLLQFIIWFKNKSSEKAEKPLLIYRFSLKPMKSTETNTEKLLSISTLKRLEPYLKVNKKRKSPNLGQLPLEKINLLPKEK